MKKEKQTAKDITAKMQNTNKPGTKLSLKTAKRCASICVDEILSLHATGNEIGLHFWQAVKMEIEKI